MPSLDAISPNFGPQLGGTEITINGSNFGDNIANIEVVIDGVSCNVTDV